MTDVGQKERLVQERLVKLFQDELEYDYLGDWQHREGNSNIEEDLLAKSLLEEGHEEGKVKQVLSQVKKAAGVGGMRKLYDANRDFYELLRYGVRVNPEGEAKKETIDLINWDDPEENNFAIAEEVTVLGKHEKRPDIVLYVNGIALGVIELKRSYEHVSKGIRQNIGNQSPEFIEEFFSTVQLLFAGNDTQGLRYGVIKTPEKFWLTWKEDGEESQTVDLDRSIRQMCSRERFLEIIHDFIVFDAGIKKTCRPNQYFAVKAAQPRVEAREGGVIWHAQGTGKSLTMIWLANWIRENRDNARVFIITDRDELDKQIKKNFTDTSEKIHKASSGADLIHQINSSQQDLVCSLIQKAGLQLSDGEVDDLVEEMKANLPDGYSPKGEITVFVDECHRTQSGKLRAALKELMPEAMFIGFTGTPLLKRDKKRATSAENFGPAIHTYKFDEAVRDGVILDLVYESRTIDQELESPEKVDQWFEDRTDGLSEPAKARLKQIWGTLQNVLTSKSRAERIVEDIVVDMEVRDRLKSGKGNALLVSGDIHQACKFYELFQKTPTLKGKVWIVTSYVPYHGKIALADSGEGQNEELMKYETYRQMLADYFNVDPDKAVNMVEKFDDDVKERFVEEPAQVKLLIVVDKLLTGFDAPPATYLYVDKEMRDHGLFQAVCRVNRLDGEDKEYGTIIDYKGLLGKLSDAFDSYTGGALDGYDAEDIEGLLNDRLAEGKARLDDSLERVEDLCKGVEQPKKTKDYLKYFCSPPDADEETASASERRRAEFYKAVNALVRAFGNLANEMTDAGYSEQQAKTIKERVQHYDAARSEVGVGSGDIIDFTAYEADMRFILDTYIRAKPSEVGGGFPDAGLVEVLATDGVGGFVKEVPEGIAEDEEAVGEAIANNIGSVISEQRPINPKFYDKMSALLNDLIERHRKEAIEQQKYLEELVELAKALDEPQEKGDYPDVIKTNAQRALLDNIELTPEAVVTIDEAIQEALEDDWRGSEMKQRQVRKAISAALASVADPDGATQGGKDQLVQQILELAIHQDDY